MYNDNYRLDNLLNTFGEYDRVFTTYEVNGRRLHGEDFFKEISDAIVLFVHGYNETPLTSPKLIKKCLKNNLSFSYFHFYNTGNSDTVRKLYIENYLHLVDALECVVSSLRKKYNKRIILIGQSLGGSITILHNVLYEKYKSEKDIRGIILTNPMTSISVHKKAQLIMKHIIGRTHLPWLKQIKRVKILEALPY